MKKAETTKTLINEETLFLKSSIKGQDTEILGNVLRCGSMFNNFLYNYFHSLDLSEPQFMALITIYSSKDPMTFSDISKRLLVSRANISGIIERLEIKKMVKRVGDKEDRRVYYISLTDEAKKTIDKIIPEYKKNIAKMLSGLTATDKKNLNDLLTKLRVTFSERKSK